MGLEETGGLQGIELVGGIPVETNAMLFSDELELGLVSSMGWDRNRHKLWRLPIPGILREG